MEQIEEEVGTVAGDVPQAQVPPAQDRLDAAEKPPAEVPWRVMVDPAILETWDKKISRGAFGLLIKLAGFARTNAYCYPGNEKLHEKPGSLNRYLKELEAKGCIRRVEIPGTNKNIRVGFLLLKRPDPQHSVADTPEAIATAIAEMLAAKKINRTDARLAPLKPQPRRKSPKQKNGDLQVSKTTIGDLQVSTDAIPRSPKVETELEALELDAVSELTPLTPRQAGGFDDGECVPREEEIVALIASRKPGGFSRVPNSDPNWTENENYIYSRAFDDWLGARGVLQYRAMIASGRYPREELDAAWRGVCSDSDSGVYGDPARWVPRVNRWLKKTS